MAGTVEELVWYASYGSNCSAERFQMYLSGGAAPGAARPERGARDTRPPRASEAHWFTSSVRFAGISTKWGSGGMAFLDHDHDHAERRAPGRRYLITRQQLEDIAAQESRREVRDLRVDSLVPGELHVVGDRRYDGVRALDPVDGIPVMTFTSPRPVDSTELNPPSREYLATIVRGLAEVHDLAAEELARHLHAAPGVASGWSVTAIVGLLAK